MKVQQENVTWWFPYCFRFRAVNSVNLSRILTGYFFKVKYGLYSKSSAKYTFCKYLLGIPFGTKTSFFSHLSAKISQFSDLTPLCLRFGKIQAKKRLDQETIVVMVKRNQRRLLEGNGYQTVVSHVKVININICCCWPCAEMTDTVFFFLGGQTWAHIWANEWNI